MSAGLVNALLRQLRPRPTGSDGELLRRFTAQHDEAAFEELLARHGSLVWGVCRRALPNRADAEDAFQATFLILAQRAHAIRKPDSLGCWLHGVAYRVARRMRGRAVRTSPTLGDVQSAHVEAPNQGPTVREFLAALDEELTRLPEKYRAPLVLCYLREQTRDEAARQLGISLSTLKRRLETARERLRLRLARRGVELPATLAATALAGAVPSSVASATLRVAVVGPAAGLVSANVLTVTEGVVRTMWQMKLRAWAAGAFMASAAVSGTGYFVAHTGAAQPGGTGPGASDKPATGEKPAATKPPGEDLSDPVARTKRLRELLNTITRKAALVDHFLHRFKGTPSERKTQMERAVTELTEAKKQFDRIAAMGPIAWDKSIPADLDVRTQVQRSMADAAFKSWQYWDSNRNQPNSLDAMRSEAELKFADLELAAFRAATKAAQPVARGPVPPASPELRKLREEKLKAAKEALATALKLQQAPTPGRPTSDGAQIEGTFIYDWSRRVLETEREIDPLAANRVKAAREHLDRMKTLEAKQATRFKQATASFAVASAATFYRLEAEIWLKEAEAARPKASAPPAGFRGTVTRGGKGYITFTPGSDAGVRRGMVFQIYRRGQPSVEIGRVVVGVVNPEEAVGRYEQSVPVAARVTGEEEVPRPGDELRPE